ncbi:MAG: petC [Phenylobacterium sp.]|jgi:ubiquinol-cytochrome c reductase cytochrome c1 subunit|uniref:cytochrome c1 n=1 Tax=Phenylobacterium sp. TaxID=1871053 RepID=UPI00262F7583|nr:cytochrome c1 [Phenylobacterium sp.]MDB5462727.1 petC [Phenylobacterium sp.]MDB5499030.1 petC [Phenylobacterium sp.]
MLRKGFAFAALGLALLAGPAFAATTQEEPKALEWSFNGPFGKFNQEQVQRGYKVYREVCSACHAMDLMYFRNLGQKGGPFYDPKYPNPNNSPVVKSLAHDIQVKDIDTDTGDPISRPGTPADKFPAPFPNEYAARASNGGSLPPDLSMMAKAREGGPDYIYSLLSGFRNPPPGLKLAAGKYYNPYYPGDLTSSWSGPPSKVPVGGAISMPPPLTNGKVTFDDGTPSTVQQEAKDVAAFLAWAAEPKMEERKTFGLGAMIYLLIFSVLLWFSYKQIWRNVAH